ncbi:MAG: undecaprenyl-diphosphate phosphatase [Patescibacteria group bacterium]|jgi:undecaprenyl-diphosphatase
MNFLHALIFGLVEGITEFLPVSSTGHLMLTAKILGLGQTEFLKTFEISIQLGAILSVVALYWRKLLVNFEVMKRIAAAFIPTGVIGLVFYKIVKTYLLESAPIVIWSLLIGGIFMIAFEKWRAGQPEIPEQRLEDLPYKKCVAVGIFQALAMVPGVSRSAATILGGLYLGLSRKAIVEFSFLLAVPTMLAATGLDLFKNYGAFNGGEAAFLAIGFITSFATAIFAIKFMISYIKKHTFMAFGIYRVAIAILFLLTAFLG